MVSNFEDPVPTALVKETIEHISDGSPHCAGAIKVWLKKAFELKKQKILESGVQLRCSRRGCVRNAYPASFRVAGSSIYCDFCYRDHYGDHHMQCSGCGHKRIKASDKSCWDCRKRFV